MSIYTLSRSFKLLSSSYNFIKLPKITLPVCQCIQDKFYSTDLTQNESQKTRKKTAIIPKITLISGTEINITTMEEAQKISKRRDLKLVKIVDLDTKTQRPVYKLMTGTEYHAEDLKQREQRKKEKQNASIKGEKVVMLSANIAEHDIDVNIKKISKWLKKLYEVRVVINGDNANIDKAEKVYTYLEEGLKEESRFVQKRLKGSDIKFQILPPKQNKNDNESNL